MSRLFKTPILTPFANAMQHALDVVIKRMNLVTREEFDIQTQLLVKTKLRIAELEKQLAAIEVAQIE